MSKGKEVDTATDRGTVLPKIVAFAIKKGTKIDQEKNVDVLKTKQVQLEYTHFVKCHLVTRCRNNMKEH